MADLSITPRDIEDAWERIAAHVRLTPIIALEFDGAPVTAKLEYLQHAGSFKARGAYNALLSQPLTTAGVVAASGGNFGIAIAHAARTLGCAAHIFVPEITAAAKIDRLRSLGAHVHIGGAVYDEAREAGARHAEQTGALIAHAYDHPATVAGAGTCGRELDLQAEFDTVLVAVGGGGLIAGIAAWFGDRVRIVAVETEKTPTLFAARAAGGPVHVDVGGIASDALGASRLGDIAWEISERFVDDAVLVSDGAVTAAQERLWRDARIATEPAGATALAALLARAYVPAADERVALLVCGANTATLPSATLAR